MRELSTTFYGKRRRSLGRPNHRRDDERIHYFGFGPSREADDGKRTALIEAVVALIDSKKDHEAREGINYRF